MMEDQIHLSADYHDGKNISSSTDYYCQGMLPKQRIQHYPNSGIQMSIGTVEFQLLIN